MNGSKIEKGDIMIGLNSSGLHTNGYSLARAVLFPKYKHDQYFEELGKTLGEALLAVHKSYLKSVLPLVESEILHGISHITGGGIIGNTKRILSGDQKMKIDWNAWNLPPLFEIIQSAGEISDDEMRAAFNLGIGMILVVNNKNADLVFESCKEHNPVVMGEII